MTRTISRTVLPIFSIVILALAAPLSAQADGGEDGFVQTVNGYQVALVFAGEPAIGENQIHVEVRDVMGMPVSAARVEVTLAAAEEEHPGEEQELLSHADMPGMDMAATEVSSHAGMAGMDMSEPANAHEGPAHAEIQAILLEPAHEAGEYSGEIHIESTGDWLVRVHLTIQEEVLGVDFPLTVKSGSRTGILIGFIGVNILIMIVAVAFKSKSAAR